MHTHMVLMNSFFKFLCSPESVLVTQVIRQLTVKLLTMAGIGRHFKSFYFNFKQK